MRVLKRKAPPAVSSAGPGRAYASMGVLDATNALRLSVIVNSPAALLPCLRHGRARATEGVTALARVSDDLLLAAQSGDRHALTQLLVALQPDIRRYARRLCHRTSVIEDVVQEALIVVYRRVGFGAHRI